MLSTDLYTLTPCMCVQEAEHVGLKLTGKRVVARNRVLGADDGGDAGMEGGVLELRSMMPDKGQMSDVYDAPPQPQPPKRGRGQQGVWQGSNSIV